MIEKSSKKHEKMKVSNLGNHGFSVGKTHISQKITFYELGRKKYRKNHQKSRKIQ